MTQVFIYFSRSNKGPIRFKETRLYKQENAVFVLHSPFSFMERVSVTLSSGCMLLLII